MATHPAPLWHHGLRRQRLIACCESLAGQTDEAIDHLRRAIEISERSRTYAKDDSDFDPIRDEPAFKALVGHTAGAT